MARGDEPHLAEALTKAVGDIERKFGVGALQRLGDVPNAGVEALPTGFRELDQILGIGGWPRGRICEVFGPESVSVTTLLLQAIAAAQLRGGIVAFVDVDHAFNPDYARQLGCRVEEIFIAQPDDGPMALEIVDALVRCGAFDNRLPNERAESMAPETATPGGRALRFYSSVRLAMQRSRPVAGDSAQQASGSK